MTKIQIVEHDCAADGALPFHSWSAIGPWLEAHGLESVRSMRVVDGRITGVRLLKEDGRFYLWHVADHTRHPRVRSKADCPPCAAVAEREVAWTEFDVPLQAPPPVIEVERMPSRIYVDPESLGIHYEGCTAIDRDPECSCGAVKLAAS